MAAQRVSQTQSASGTQAWPTQPSASQMQSPPGVVASQRVGSGQRPVDFLRYIKLPQDYSSVLAIILERPPIGTLSDEGRVAKAQELIDLRAAIISSPDLNAWRQGISPEAYRNPTKFGGTDPRDPDPGYIRLSYPQLRNPTTSQVIDAWIRKNHPGLTYDRIAADGKIYTFKANTQAYADKAPGAGDQYSDLINLIEQRYRAFARGNRMPDEGKWPRPMGKEPADVSDTPSHEDLYGPRLSPLIPPRL